MFDFVRKNDNVADQIAELVNRVRELESEVEKLAAALQEFQKPAEVAIPETVVPNVPEVHDKVVVANEAVVPDKVQTVIEAEVPAKKAEKKPKKKAEAPAGEKKAPDAEKKSKKELKEAREARKKEKYLAQVMKITGWDRETAQAKMERALKVAGSSYEHYAIYRFWELDEETQKTYFTKREAVTLRRKYNTDKELLNILKNKDLCCTKFEEFLGRPWMRTTDMTLESFKEKFADQKKIIYKPIASSGGHGIRVMEIGEGALETVYENLKALPAGIIEGYLIQHPLMQQLSENSVNTIRIVTIRTKENMPDLEKDKVYFLYSGIRMGQGKSYVDNLHSGGLMAAVDVETGNVVTGGVDHKVQMFDVHPSTGAQIKGFNIPYYQEAKQMIEKASKTKGVYGLLGWDVAITENGPVLIEINTSPGADGLQTPYVPQQKGMRYVIEKYL